SRLPTRRTQWCHQFESEHPAFADLGPDLEPADSPIEHTDVRIRMQMIIRDAEGNLHRVGRAVLGGLPKLKRKERKAVTTIDRNNVEPAPYVSRDDPTEGA
ncbi:MAG: hypothetical protein QOD72_2874, partial [Acidimicrobiaceae bacterium]|nr:hypothetical protein [Acidimicrobiaceae bacterium]